MYKFSFVILHYLSYDYTNDCINSILKNLFYDNYYIVVVDNASTNDSFDRLNEKYKNNKKIYFLRNEKNLGFAKGNNIGYKYAKYILKSDFIILLNNDTIIEQKDTLKNIINIYEINKFYLMGPDIIGLDGKHQNPQSLSLLKEESLIRYMNKLKFKIVLSYLNLDGFASYIYGMIKKKFKKDLIFYDKELVNVQLHGACLIFSPLYLKKFDGLYDKTFLDMEEHILYYTLMRENLMTLYSPEIKIIHREYGSTKTMFKSSSKSRRFRYKTRLESTKILLKYMKNYESEKYNFMII
ncbi:glycosyltransferase [Clostridium thermopalmarium]|uniref:N-glycosyltransferase n=1 Tax=Clostridium thermopalmarium DSM 5974 TaxID=1121340 RepID=A0A2T0ALN4_9CLOT|nr:glycosyltransferase [Clostridium thermopalmarium]PRR69659.1 N-glycosyltransferase [Clostridium thermopalmarium DSM 5974]PVZ24272.1 GT2 family glycosyltransferase [Clostridium thermopalmarium DSM 5974]